MLVMGQGTEDSNVVIFWIPEGQLIFHRTQAKVKGQRAQSTSTQSMVKRVDRANGADRGQSQAQIWRPTCFSSSPSSVAERQA